MESCYFNASNENSCFNVPDDGFPEIIMKQFDQKNVQYSVVSNDDESCWKLAAGSMVDTGSRESSSLIDLKLGGLSDDHTLNSGYSSVVAADRVLLSAESATAAKRARAAVGLSSQTAYCQVYGCNKDLSSAKDYHKRHKVCDAHSKTARVIVNGIEQRFCQQCSRFHLLAEFDDGKRSCRKRLAGHNERRRKPQVSYGRNRNGRSLHSYGGSISSKFQRTSFICQDILGPTHSEKYPSNNWSKGIKIENDASAYTQLEQKTILPHYLFENQYTSAIESRVYTESHSSFQTNLVGSEDLTLYDTASAIQGIPGMSESGCALSLLSSQSHNSHSSNTSVIQTNCPQFGMTQVYSTLPILDDGDVGLANGTVDGFSRGDGTTIDLLQLSSQLQRVENLRQSEPAKQDNGRCLLF